METRSSPRRLMPHVSDDYQQYRGYGRARDRSATIRCQGLELWVCTLKQARITHGIVPKYVLFTFRSLGMRITRIAGARNRGPQSCSCLPAGLEEQGGNLRPSGPTQELVRVPPAPLAALLPIRKRLDPRARSLYWISPMKPGNLSGTRRGRHRISGETENAGGIFRASRTTANSTWRS